MQGHRVEAQISYCSRLMYALVLFCMYIYRYVQKYGRVTNPQEHFTLCILAIELTTTSSTMNKYDAASGILGIEPNRMIYGMPFIHSLVHLENLYSALSRNLLRDAPSPTTVKKISFKQLVEQRHFTLC